VVKINRNVEQRRHAETSRKSVMAVPYH
jgi:hypothetical protein